MRWTIVLLSFQAMLLTACDTGLEKDRGVGVGIADLEKMSPSEVEDVLIGYTIRTTSLRNGQRIGTYVSQIPLNQIVYFGANNVSHIWKSGESGVHAIPWKVKWVDLPADPDDRVDRAEDQEGYAVCFNSPAYPPSSIGVLPEQEWRCRWLRHMALSAVQRIRGDPFNLASGRAPGYLEEWDYSLERLYKIYRIRPPSHLPKPPPQPPQTAPSTRL